jgi:hypothetical protein
MVWVNYYEDPRQFEAFFKQSSNTNLNSALAAIAPKPEAGKGTNMLTSLHRYSVPIDLVKTLPDSKPSTTCQPVKYKMTSPPQQTLEQAQSDIARSLDENPSHTHTNKKCSCKKKAHSSQGSKSKHNKKSLKSSKKSKGKKPSKSKNKSSKSSSKKSKKSSKELKRTKNLKIETKLKSVL